MRTDRLQDAHRTRCAEIETILVECASAAGPGAKASVAALDRAAYGDRQCTAAATGFGKIPAMTAERSPASCGRADDPHRLLGMKSARFLPEGIVMQLELPDGTQVGEVIVRLSAHDIWVASIGDEVVLLSARLSDGVSLDFFPHLEGRIGPTLRRGSPHVAPYGAHR